MNRRNSGNTYRIGRFGLPLLLAPFLLIQAFANDEEAAITSKQRCNRVAKRDEETKKREKEALAQYFFAKKKGCLDPAATVDRASTLLKSAQRKPAEPAVAAPAITVVVADKDKPKDAKHKMCTDLAEAWLKKLSEREEPWESKMFKDKQGKGVRDITITNPALAKQACPVSARQREALNLRYDMAESAGLSVEDSTMCVCNKDTSSAQRQIAEKLKEARAEDRKALEDRLARQGSFLDQDAAARKEAADKLAADKLAADKLAADKLAGAGATFPAKTLVEPLPEFTTQSALNDARFKAKIEHERLEGLTAQAAQLQAQTVGLSAADQKRRMQAYEAAKARSDAAWDHYYRLLSTRVKAK